jgi:hypothetical protein
MENLIPAIDVSPAAEYGDIEVLIEANNTGIAIQPLISLLRSRLKDFCDEDYILPVGDSVAIGVVTAIAADFNLGRVKMLRWDRQSRKYIPMRFNSRGKSVIDTERETV